MAKNNESAQTRTGFVYPAGGGNDIGVYKQPMPTKDEAPKTAVAVSGNAMAGLNISVAGISKGNYPTEEAGEEKTMRGYGAATKGIKTRGPMA